MYSYDAVDPECPDEQCVTHAQNPDTDSRRLRAHEKVQAADD